MTELPGIQESKTIVANQNGDGDRGEPESSADRSARHCCEGYRVIAVDRACRAGAGVKRSTRIATPRPSGAGRPQRRVIPPRYLQGGPRAVIKVSAQGTFNLLEAAAHTRKADSG